MGLETVELVLDIEKHFSIDFADDDIEDVETVESLCQLIRRSCVNKDGFNARSDSYIYQYLVNLLSSEYGIPREVISPASRIVKDLGLD